jgi:putative ABC transport system substrate-binding protein
MSDPTRRRFVKRALAAALALPGLAMAQAPRGTRSVALVLASSPATASHLAKAVVEGLAERGWAEGRNLRLEVGYGENDPARMRKVVADLLERRPDVFVAGNETVARHAAALTKTTPIVFALGFDPIGAGLVRSLAKPGGNVTGISVLSYELMPKRLALLKEAVPGATHVGFLYRAGDSNSPRLLEALAGPAKTLGVTIIPAPVSDAANLEEAFEKVAKHKATAVLGAHAGALFSYGPELASAFRRAAVQVDRILKGADAAVLPVEQANVYELVVNLKTARRLGLALPRTFMLQATQVID